MKKFIIQIFLLNINLTDRETITLLSLFLTFPQASKQRELVKSKICKGIIPFLVLSHSQPYTHIV